MSKNLFINIVLLVTLSLILTAMGLNFHMTEYPLVGDASSHALQALSIAHDLDLKYDERDGKYWKELNWSKNPDGLFFQSYQEGYAFAKPYGYSLFLAVFIFLFGTAGFAVGNVLIFGLINVFIFLTLRVFYEKMESVLLTISFTFFSYVYMYVFYVHSDLFLALLSSIFVFLLTKLFDQPNKLYFTALCLVTAFIVSEKPPAILVIFPVLFFYFLKNRGIRVVGTFALLFLVGFFLFILPYLHYSDYKSWNPYKGNRFYSTMSNQFTFDSNRPPSSYHAIDTGRHFDMPGVIKRVLDTSEAGEKARSFYYYFFGAYTGMVVFIPFAFLIITLSILRIMNKPDLQLLAAPLIGIFLYILFYVALFHTNYYGGGQSLGNRYFLQVFPFLVLPLGGLKLKKKKVVVLSLLTLGLSIIFVYKHHLEPERAHIDIVKSGHIQGVMPFEKNQIQLQPYITGDKMVNRHMYPSPPREARYDYLIDLKGKRFAVQAQNITNLSKWIEVSSSSDLFRETTVNGKPVLLNTGFYQSEKTHVWSKKESALLLRNSRKIERFSVNSYMPGTMVKLHIGDNERVAQAPFSLEINTSESGDKWILIRFKADKSGIPSKITKSKDTRDLSFSLAYRGGTKSP